jgi:peptidoglycan/xylan/chitin deacetylase (PgdA/CDA1 family)
MKFRLDRMASLGLASTKLTRWRQAGAGRVPILMYHGINHSVGTRHPYFETNTSPAVFRSQMEMLSKGGYRAFSLDQALCAPCSRAANERPIALTFDDGYADFYDEALPILIEFGFTATMYVVTGSTSEHRLIKDGKRFMSWTEVSELPKYGVSVGSHTVSHGKLWEMSRSRIEDEIRRSKEILENKLCAPVESFAYPYAFPEHDTHFVRYTRECLQMCGYKNAVSTIIGTASKLTDPYLLPRLPVNTFDDNGLFRAKLEGGYEWLRVLQYAKKICVRGA